MKTSISSHSQLCKGGGEIGSHFGRDPRAVGRDPRSPAPVEFSPSPPTGTPFHYQLHFVSPHLLPLQPANPTSAPEATQNSPLSQKKHSFLPLFFFSSSLSLSRTLPFSSAGYKPQGNHYPLTNPIFHLLCSGHPKPRRSRRPKPPKRNKPESTSSSLLSLPARQRRSFPSRRQRKQRPSLIQLPSTGRRTSSSRQNRHPPDLPRGVKTGMPSPLHRSSTAAITGHQQPTHGRSPSASPPPETERGGGRGTKQIEKGKKRSHSRFQKTNEIKN